jgi:hypothetical protein
MPFYERTALGKYQIALRLASASGSAEKTAWSCGFNRVLERTLPLPGCGKLAPSDLGEEQK